MLRHLYELSLTITFFIFLNMSHNLQIITHHFKLYNSVVLVYSQMCDHQCYLIPERYHHKKKPLLPCTVIPILLGPCPWQLLIYFLSLKICLLWRFI